MEKAADDSDIAFSVLTYVLSSAAIIINLLIIAVIVASEKVSQTVRWQNYIIQYYNTYSMF